MLPLDALADRVPVAPAVVAGIQVAGRTGMHCRIAAPVTSAPSGCEGALGDQAAGSRQGQPAAAGVRQGEPPPCRPAILTAPELSVKQQSGTGGWFECVYEQDVVRSAGVDEDAAGQVGRGLARDRLPGLAAVARLV